MAGKPLAQSGIVDVFQEINQCYQAINFEKLVKLAEQLGKYRQEIMEELECTDEYNEITDGRLLGYPGL